MVDERVQLLKVKILGIAALDWRPSVYISIYLSIYRSIYLSAYLSVYLYLYLYTCTCTCTCTSIYIYRHTHTHTYIHKCMDSPTFWPRLFSVSPFLDELHAPLPFLKHKILGSDSHSPTFYFKVPSIFAYPNFFPYLSDIGVSIHGGMDGLLGIIPIKKMDDNWEYPNIWKHMEPPINQWEFQDPKMDVPTKHFLRPMIQG